VILNNREPLLLNSVFIYCQL